MKKTTAIVVILCVIFLFDMNQAKGQEIIYSDSLDFTARLFKRAHPENHNCAAEISTTIRFHVAKRYRDSITVEVVAVMDTQNSWISIEYLNSVDVLEHEKYHFVLSEFYARKFRLFLSNLDEISYSNYKEKIYSQYRILKEELREMQSVYDQETDFGRNKISQNQWIAKLDESLLNFYDFSRTQVTLEVGY